ncbi:MAG: discoidin domain-containing protein [Bacteroidales bacterium]|jgi:hypothetical protein|nr:discoidin domain-containing protein [Bacteroidales bacterium]
MKNIIFIAGIILLYAGCKPMDSVYEEYLKPNGIVYPGKATDPAVLPGKNRAMLTWHRGTDANVVKAKIYWNDFTESKEVDIPETGDTIRVMIAPLAETNYSFIIYTFDGDGNQSVPVEVNGTVYGDAYGTGLVGRNVEIAEYIDNKLLLYLGPPDVTNGAIATDISYKKEGENDSVTLRVPWTENSPGVCAGYAPGSDLKYRTVYLPETACLDTFYSSYTLKTPVPPEVKMMNRTGWDATADGYQATSTLAPNVLDGNLGTVWHSNPTAGGNGPVNYPHWIALDMQKTIVVHKIVLYMRSAVPGNTFKDFIVQRSMDGEAWTDCEQFVFQGVALTPQPFTLATPQAMQHIRLWCINSHANPYAVLAEFELYGFESF